MANTLTNLIPTLYAALDVVSRELVGFIPAVSRDAKTDMVALNQNVNVPVVGAISAGNITPGSVPPDDGDAAPGNVQVSITKSRYAPVRWNGEEQLALGPTGIYQSVNAQRFMQAFRTLTNEIEADLAALHIYASRAYGTAGTAPFGTAADFTDLSNSVKILQDNGAPTDMHCVLGTSAMANLLGKQSSLFKVNEAGTDMTLRTGAIGVVQGVNFHTSGQVKTHTAGTGASATTDATGYAVGTTTLTLASAGTGTILAGDVITFAGDTNKYVVVTGDADVSNGGTIVIAEPGLRVAMSAAAKAITVVASSARNMVFSRSAIQLAARLPQMPEGGDDADDVMVITDPVSGLSFQIAVYKQYRQVKFEVGAAWGVKMIAPRHSALLLG